MKHSQDESGKDEVARDRPRRSTAATALLALVASVGISGSAEATVDRVQRQINALRAGSADATQSLILQHTYRQSPKTMPTTGYCQYTQSLPEPRDEYTQTYTQEYTQNC